MFRRGDGEGWLRIGDGVIGGDGGSEAIVIDSERHATTAENELVKC